MKINILAYLMPATHALVAFLICYSPSWASTDVRRVITVKDPRTGKVYGTATEETRPDGTGREIRETVYRNSSGEAVQKDVTAFDPASLEVSAYTFENTQSGELVQVNANGNKVRIVNREPGRKDAVTIDTQWARGAAFGKLLDRWIIKNRDALAKGEFVPLALYIPSKADSYSFRLRFDKKASNGKEDIFVMEARNWFIRLFIPHVELRFNREAGYKLVSILGPYPILSEAENQGKQVLFAID
jgi:hypothetical protein